MNTAAAHPLDGLYHKDLGFPAQSLDQVLGKTFNIAMLAGSHARRALVDDRYLSAAVADGREDMPGRFDATDLLPRSVTVDRGNLVHLEVVNGRVVQALVRVPATKKFDIVLALGLDGARTFLRTVWLNRKSDQHKTLNAAAYRTP